MRPVRLTPAGVLAKCAGPGDWSPALFLELVTFPNTLLESVQCDFLCSLALSLAVNSVKNRQQTDVLCQSSLTSWRQKISSWKSREARDLDSIKLNQPIKLFQCDWVAKDFTYDDNIQNWQV
ncbi:hypothetical protein EVAR_29401_1 [Eumeta japonica]|uniref:Uncharacterized protein n=1 Tax=Eumeta variegata TaxID=151549 RepID=A0A4C1VSC1_EUMVA|nr:hypothetical protein EVAR_29401_1 [Eumeta japonica]